jgi:hypothetical protein
MVGSPENVFNGLLEVYIVLLDDVKWKGVGFESPASALSPLEAWAAQRGQVVAAVGSRGSSHCVCHLETGKIKYSLSIEKSAGLRSRIRIRI